MTDLDALRAKSMFLEQQIRDQLQRRKDFSMATEVSNANDAFQQQTQLKVMREKLQTVVASRKRANESNKKLLADFDRIQKHLALMDSKTDEMMTSIDDHKKYLDDNFPNWRAKAALITSPNYINQESVFNMLDSLRCRLDNDDDKEQAFKGFTNKSFTLDETRGGLVHLLDPKSGDINPKLLKPESKTSASIEKAYEKEHYEKENESAHINRTYSNPSYYNEPVVSEPPRETKSKSVTIEHASKDTISSGPVSSIHISKDSHSRGSYNPREPELKHLIQDSETLTNITESEQSIPLSPTPESLVESLSSLIMPDDGEDEGTEETITPRSFPVKRSPAVKQSPAVKPSPSSYKASKQSPSSSYGTKDPLQDPKLYTSKLPDIDISTESEDDIENMLNPGSKKPTSPKPRSPRGTSPNITSPKQLSPKQLSPKKSSPKEVFSPKVKSPKALFTTQVRTDVHVSKNHRYFKHL